MEVGGKGKKFKNKNQYPETTSYRNNPANTTTFYITNFPDDVNDLWKSFARYWRVGEVYIPAKTDRHGKRFGFARFADVDNVQSLLEKIEGTWIGTFKIRANISRFKRGDVGEDLAAKHVGAETTIRQGEEERDQVESTFKHALVMGGKKQIPVIDAGRKKIILNRPIVQKSNNTALLRLKLYKATFHRLNQCFVGFLREEMEPVKLQMLIAMEGFQLIKSASLGVDVFLLSSSQQEGVKNALAVNQDWWNRWFSEIKRWNPHLVPAGGSSRSSIKGWRSEAAGSNLGWVDGGSDGESGDELLDPLCNNRSQPPTMPVRVSEERGSGDLVMETDAKKQDVVRRCQEGKLTCEEDESGRLQEKVFGVDYEVGSLSTTHVDIGPPTLGLNSFLDLGNGVLEITTKEGVDLNYFPLLNGGCSLGPIGPNPSHVDLELCCVNRLKDKQIGFLAWQESLLASSCPSGNVSNLVKDFKTGHKERDGKKKYAAEFGCLTKCERFAKAVRGGKGARKGKKKGRKIGSSLENGEHEESISNDSLDQVELRPKGKRSSIPILALQVVLTEGDSNRVYDAGSEAGGFNLNNFVDGILSSAVMGGLLVAYPIFASLAKSVNPFRLIGVGSLAAPFIDDNAPASQKTTWLTIFTCVYHWDTHLSISMVVLLEVILVGVMHFG
ncbi:Major facilitator superfamily protein [Trifolium repens]|nr:Major facilitator superfamily protein [Trifolium repens]